MMAEQRAEGLLAKQGDWHDIPVKNVVTLDDIGVTLKQSADWGRMPSPSPRRSATPAAGNGSPARRASRSSISCVKILQ
jgi:hypothetical protein